MSDGLLTTVEAARRLGLPRRTFYRHMQSGEFSRLLARPECRVGQRKWDAAAVERFARGESITKFVHRRAS